MSNAFSFFNKYFAPDTAQWLTELCDEVLAKAPGDSPQEWNNIFFDLLYDQVMLGDANAWHLVRTSLQKGVSVKWVRDQHIHFDTARAAEILTGAQAGPIDGSMPPVPTDGSTTAAGTGPTAVDSSGGGPETLDTGAGSQSTGTGRGGGTVVVSGGKTGIGTQGTLFVIEIQHFQASLPQYYREARKRLDHNVDQAKTFTRRAAAEKRFIRQLEAFEAALPDVVDLAHKHRTARNLTDLLRATGLTAADFRLTDDDVRWFDSELKKAA
jgi:hypothetical protein